MTNSKTILIVEDEELLAKTIGKKLTSAGYNVLYAENGDTGLTQAKEGKPDLILLDILLPGINGFQMLEQLIHDVGEKGMPHVIVMSNSEASIRSDEILKLGVKDSLIKSNLTPEEILQKVTLYIGNMEGENPLGAGIKILAVEDDNFLRDLLARKLGHENAEFITAVDGENALKILETETPSIILLDLILPGIDGFEVLKRIKENPKTKDIPVVILSNLGQESDIDKATKLGAADFLVKANFSIDEVIGKVKAIING